MTQKSSVVIEGKRKDPYRGFRYRVIINGFESFGFSRVAGLSEETEAVDYREGIDGAHMHKLPGITTFDPITLERGLSANQDEEKWRKLVYDGNNGHGVPDDEFREDFEIVLYDYANQPVKRWEVKDGWISRLERGEFNASSSDVVLKTITIVNEGSFEQ